MAAEIKKAKKTISLDDPVWAKLDELGSRYGFSGNAVLAAAAYELSRVPPENLWQALARIAAGEEAPAALVEPPARRSGRKEHAALPA